MSQLMRAKELAKRPVVTLGGDAVGQVKDIVYDGSGLVSGFTLAGRGLFAGPLKEALAWPDVHGLGADAVMVADRSALSDPQAVLARGAGSGGGDVLGSRVLTESGTDLGEVVDVVLEVGDELDVVGYEIQPGKGKKVFVPLPDTLSAGGERIVVPDSATEFVSDDLAGFGASVTAFRERFEKGLSS